MYAPSLFVLSFLVAFLNSAEAMDVEAFLAKHSALKTEIKKELDAKFKSEEVYRGETLELILAILYSVHRDTKAYTELPKSDAHHVRTTNNGVIAPEQVRAEIKDFIKHAVGDKHGPDAALRAVVVGNVAYEECKEFLEKTLKGKVGEEPSPQENKPGKKHGDVHEDELEEYFKATLMHHETPELADAAAHFHKTGGAIPTEETPKSRKTPNGYIPENDPKVYRTEIRSALKKSKDAGLDLNGIAHAALERAEEQLGKAKQQLVQLNAAFSSK